MEIIFRFGCYAAFRFPNRARSRGAIIHGKSA
jgi:hypothetical protein